MHTLGIPEEVLTYTTIEEVYQTVVLVKNNPISNRPYIFPISQEYIKK
jgi:iron complex transport system ATP-binding protein